MRLLRYFLAGMGSLMNVRSAPPALYPFAFADTAISKAWEKIGRDVHLALSRFTPKADRSK